MAAFAEVEEPPDESVGFPGEQLQAGAQLLVAMLDIQIHGPEVGDGCPVQETVCGESFHQGLKLLCREETVSMDPRKQAVKVELKVTSLCPSSEVFMVRRHPGDPARSLGCSRGERDA